MFQLLLPPIECYWKVHFGKYFTNPQDAQDLIRILFYPRFSDFLCLVLYLPNKLSHTRRKAALRTASSPVSTTARSNGGSTVQNSFTNSRPLRRLFCRMSLARYKKGTRCSLGASRNFLPHVSTTSLAFLRWNMHQWDRAITNFLKATISKTRGHHSNESSN